MLVLLVIALLAGALLPIQAGINAQLRTSLDQPVLATLLSFAVGTIALAVWSLGARVPAPAVGVLGRLPWWQWTGGLLGAVYILATIMLAPRLGAATLIAAVVAGQMVASLVLDQFGLVGFPVHGINVWRLLGAGLVIAGAVLIQRN